MQYDFGKSIEGGEFIDTGHLNKPPNILLGAVGIIKMRHKQRGHKISEYISNMIAHYPNLAKDFEFHGCHKDQAFKSDAIHVAGKKSCKSGCGPPNKNLKNLI